MSARLRWRLTSRSPGRTGGRSIQPGAPGTTRSAAPPRPAHAARPASRSGSPGPPAATATQVVVVRPIPAGARLTARDLAVVRLPAQYAPSGAVAGPRAVLGRRVAVALPTGAPLMEAELAPDAPAFAGRDVAVRVDDAAGLPAGDLSGVRADVMLAPSGHGSEPTVVLADVQVVAAGRIDGVAVATLRLPPAAVATLIAAESRGSLRLVVRAGQDVR